MREEKPPSEWDEEIARLHAELQDRLRSLPAHSTRPHQLLIIEELEEKIAALEAKRKENKSSQGEGR